jgi:hypothetical protein
MRKLHPTNVKSIGHSAVAVYEKAFLAMMRVHQLIERENKMPVVAKTT